MLVIIGSMSGIKKMCHLRVISKICLPVVCHSTNWHLYIYVTTKAKLCFTCFSNFSSLWLIQWTNLAHVHFISILVKILRTHAFYAVHDHGLPLCVSYAPKHSGVCLLSSYPIALSIRK